MEIGGVALGLLAAICWGSADFCARGAVLRGSVFRTMLALNALASIGLALLAPTGLLSIRQPSTGAIATAVTLQLLVLGGVGLLYRAFSVGKLALVAPIAASYAVVSALLSLVSGEHLSGVQLCGIALTIVGVARASFAADRLPSLRVGLRHAAHGAMSWHLDLEPGLLEAAGAMLAWGIAFFALRYPVAELGGIPVVFLGKLGDMVVLASIAAAGAALRQLGHVPQQYTAWCVLCLPSRQFLVFVAPMALLDTTANIVYNLGLATSLTAVVSVLSALSSAVTVLLAALLLHERLTRRQSFGIAFILAGIALVSI